MSEKRAAEKEATEKEKERALLERAMEAVARIPPEALAAEPEEVVQRLSTVEFARQILGPEIMKRPDWPVLWCRLICWIKYIVCVLRCPPFLRDVLIRSVGRVDSLNPIDKTSKLIAAGEETPIGSRISISGSTNISGAGRKIAKYSLYYAPYDVALNKWVDAPPDHTLLPAGWTGPIIPPIEYVPPHIHTWHCVYTYSNIISNGDLTRKWEKSTCPFPPPTEYWWLRRIQWDTKAAVDLTGDGTPDTVPLPTTNDWSGRYTILLMVEDDLGGIYYDSQRVWFDNKRIVGYIEEIKGKKDGLLKMSLKKTSILGEAYDPPIDKTITPIVPPNNNFDHYRLWFRKQAAKSGYQDIPPGKIKTPVEGVGVLVDWDLTMLDFDTNPAGLPADQLLKKGESCPYNICLYVCDKTHVNDSATVHHIYDHCPVQIVNDLE